MLFRARSLVVYVVIGIDISTNIILAYDIFRQIPGLLVSDWKDIG